MLYFNIFRYKKIHKWISHSPVCRSFAKYNFLWLIINILEYLLIHVCPRRFIFQVLKLASKDAAFYRRISVGNLHYFLLFMAIQFVKVWCKAVHFSTIGRQHEAEWIAKHKMFLCLEKERKATGFQYRLYEFIFKGDLYCIHLYTNR